MKSNVLIITAFIQLSTAAVIFNDTAAWEKQNAASAAVTAAEVTPNIRIPSLALLGGKKAKVKIKNGVVQGYHNDNFDQEFFLGIPYAEPPLGKKRFAAPEPYKKIWKEDFDATKYGNICYSNHGKNNHADDGLKESEDCLFINIVRPSGKNKLPVFVYIQDGAFQFDSSSRDLYNLSYPVKQSINAAKPVLGVSFNYRTNAFGFLTSKINDTTANNGLRDQRLALKWVQENIDKFGGDPKKVTIWGTGSGAVSAAYQMMAYGGKNENLFHRAILQSGYPHSIPLRTEKQSRKVFLKLATKVKCLDDDDDDADDKTIIKCLRSKSPGDIIKAVGPMHESFLPAIDGDFLNSTFDAALNRGKINAVSVITAETLDEGTSRYISLGKVDTDSQIIKKLLERYPALDKDTAKTLIALYPTDPSKGSPYYTGQLFGTEFGKQWKRGNSIAGDISVHASRRLFTNILVDRGFKVYAYCWDQSNIGTPPQLGASHFTDVVYTFSNPTSLNQSKSATIDKTNDKSVRLSFLVSQLFMGFVATGDPNNAALTQTRIAWQPITTYKRQMYFFNAKKSRYMSDDYRFKQIKYIINNLAKFQ